MVLSACADLRDPFEASDDLHDMDLQELSIVEGPNFIRISGARAVTGLACISQDAARPALQKILQEIQTDGLDPAIAVVLAADETECSSIFYAPVANDIQGIGYRHWHSTELFDESPDSRLQGIVYLNDLPYWLEQPDEFITSFLHELGHRWSARVHIRSESLPPDALLGRQLVHWSYFLHTGGSPLEGNDWSATGSGNFTAHTPTATRIFSNLDLYLMGALEPENVGLQELLIPEAIDDLDCFGDELTSGSPPQFCESTEISATPYEFSVKDVIAEEGPRVPAASADQSVDVAVFLLESQGGMKGDDCRRLQVALDEAFEAFWLSTGGRMSLRNLSASSAICAGE